MPINLSLGFISYLISTLLFLGVLFVAFIGQKQFSSGKPFFLLIIATFVWSSLLTMSQIGASIAYEMIFIAELLRYYTWFYILQLASGNYSFRDLKAHLKNPLSPLYISLLFVLSFASLIANDYLAALFELTSINLVSIIWLLIFSILGTLIVEQLYRNTPHQNRQRILYLCLSAGAVFIFDFFVYSNALLVQQINYELWSARGIINVLIAPTLILAAVRNPTLAPQIHISRQFVFHSTTLFSSGVYLVFMAVAGYYIKSVSGDWGGVLQSIFLFAAILLFVTLFFSEKLKRKIKIYINTNFSNKYDYRAEWSRFSNTLLESDNDQNTSSIYTRSLKSICQIVDSTQAALWLKENEQYKYCASLDINTHEFNNEAVDSPLIHHIFKHKYLISSNEFLDLYDDHMFASLKKSWFILPIWLSEDLMGFILILKPIADSELDEEDKQLLTTVAHQLALFLSQHKTSIALQQTEKFKGINQMTAFLTHDLKTLLSQLTLIVENGRIHKDNPAFIEDMMNTLDHVTQKMQRLVQQVKEPASFRKIVPTHILSLLNEILDEYKLRNIKFSVINKEKVNPSITTDKDELYSALKHIIQNAVESLDEDKGKVEIAISMPSNNNLCIKITDNGKGMSQEFINNRLFQPFDSTKGVSGMGIGVYQSREIIYELGGDIQVESEVSLGTTFNINLPVN